MVWWTSLPRSFQNGGADGSAANARLTKVDGNQMITSFIGFKGDRGSGRWPESRLCHRVLSSGPTRVNRGDLARATPCWSRAANVWVQGGLGQLTLGRQGTLLFVNTLQFNPLSSAFGLSPAIRLTFGSPWGE